MGAPRIGVGIAFEGWWLIVQGWELLSKRETLHRGVGTSLRDHVHMTSAQRGGGGVQELPNFVDGQY